MNTLSSPYRPFCSYWWKYWFSPRSYYYYVKYKWQRAQRGWADCDVWSLDHYLAAWLPGALEHLKKTKHGIPCAMFREEDNGVLENGCWGPSEAATKRAEREWDAVLDKMIAGFKAYPQSDDDEQIFDEGMALFVKYFGCLWD